MFFVHLLLQESEVTRLQARISSLERAAGRQHQSLSIPTVFQFTHSPEPSALTAPSSPKNPHTAVPSSTQSAHLISPTHTLTCTLPPAHTVPHLSHQSRDWSSIDSSLDLPPSLKATLREALSKQPWESTSPSVSSFLDSVDHSWQGLGAVDASTTSDNSFNPLTYMVDELDDRNLGLKATAEQEGASEQTSELRRESVCTLVGEEEVDMGTLTGMLRFVNQTLAMQEDPSIWSSTGQSGTEDILPLQVTPALPLFDFTYLLFTCLNS